MKQYKYLYRRMLDEDLIRKAFYKMRKGKTKRRELIKIEKNLSIEVRAMRIMIENTKPPDVEVEHPELAFKPIKHRPCRIIDGGKERDIYKPEIHELWLQHIIMLILGPIIQNHSYRYSCGSMPKRGGHYGKKIIEKWIRDGNIRYFAKADIRHFYKSIQIKIVMKYLRKIIDDEWFLYIVELCFKWFKKGLPLGFYISQWLANFLLEPLDYMIAGEEHRYVRYVDDIVMFGNNKKKLSKLLGEIRSYIGKNFRLKMKRNYQICRFDYEKKEKTIGRPVDFMGFVFYRNRTRLRKHIMVAASRIARIIHKCTEEGKRIYLKHARAMMSRLGWFKCTNTYTCYEERIKPYVKVKKLKHIISITDRRKEYAGLEERSKQTETRAA